MSNSILTSVKKNCGLADDYEYFDPDIILYINGVFGTLEQLGLGPEGGFMIDDKTPVWTDFIGDDTRLNAVKNYMVLRVRMLFDPPATAYVATSMAEQIKELEWRLNVVREDAGWLDPSTIPDRDDEGLVIVDGGSP